MRSTLPQSMWGDIVEKLDQPQQHQKVLDAETADFGGDDDGYDPTEFAEQDDEL